MRPPRRLVVDSAFGSDDGHTSPPGTVPERRAVDAATFDAATSRPGRSSRLPLSRYGRLFVLLSVSYFGFIVYEIHINQGFTYGTTLLSKLDLLFGYAVVVFGFGVGYPLATRPRIRRRYWRALTKRPETALAFVVFATFVLAGALGPTLLGAPKLHFNRAYQPPVYTTMSTEYVYECVGTVADGRCHGTWRFPLGTDSRGRDMVRVLAQASHLSLYVVAIASLLIVPIAAVVGNVAGYYGGVVDLVLAGVVEIEETLPPLVVYLLLIWTLGESLFLIILLFGFLGWGGTARTIRAHARELRSMQYVTAAEALGGSRRYVLRRHIVPGTATTVAVGVAQLAPALLLTEAGIAFLGLEGFDEMSFGNMLLKGFGRLGKEAPQFPTFWWKSVSAMVALALVVASIKVVGDALGDARSQRL